MHNRPHSVNIEPIYAPRFRVDGSPYLQHGLHTVEDEL
jgi:hypothetical protein